VTGSLVPVLEFQLDGRGDVFFEHYVLLYKSPTVALRAAMPRGAVRRLIGQMPVLLVGASGQGRLALSRDAAGQVFGVALKPGQALDVREHQFLAATSDVGYGFTRIRGIANLLFGGSGFFVDRFTAGRGPGMVWIHAYGNLLEVELEAGEALDVEPGGWCYKDASVGMKTVPVNVATGLLASERFVLNRFTGPGRLGIQSMSVYLPSEE
jgi:uncharacterized protein (AIM24 family)